MAILAMLIAIPAHAQPSQQRVLSPIVVHKMVQLDGNNGAATRNATRLTYVNSQVDTAWIDLFTADGLGTIDSIHYSIETTDTARYRVFLLFRNTSATSAGYANYNESSGLGLDSLNSQSTTPMVNDGRISPVHADGQWKPGIGSIGIGIKFSSTGNHLGTARIAAQKYGVWVTLFYRNKQVILHDKNLTPPNRL